MAIIGRANVGKSSLFNRLIERREAIVTDEPGTTRDSITGRVSVNDKAFLVVDTAGLKTPEDEFEFTIQEQITQAAESADMMLVVVENDIPIGEEDRRVAKMALKSNKPVLLVINKSDRKTGQSIDWSRLGIKNLVNVSAAHNRGVDELINEIAKHVDFGREEAENVLRFALVGRPNVGKSSLFNELLSKQQAVVAGIAGTTRDSNRKSIRWHDQAIELIDTAGIRRSGKIERGVEQFSVMRALSAIESADVCGLVIDAAEPATKLDLKIAGMIADAGKGLIIIVNKWDMIEKDAYTHDTMAAQLQSAMPFVPWAQFLFTSATSSKNVSKLFGMMVQINVNRQTKVTTTSLNRWLQQAIDHHPPAGLKSAQPKLRYVTQVGINPPQFRFFGTDTDFLHWSYKRYLERELRQLAEFEGTAIWLNFSDKKEQT